MTKPHEETWDGTVQWGWVLVEGGGLGGKAPLQPLEGERMRLAAQAPAMARLLLRVHALGNTLSGCPICKAITGPHTPNCELDAVLRAAGVLP